MATPPPLPPAVIRSLITFYLGGWDLAICADLIFQGIIFAQVAHYTTLYTKDFLAMRAFVAVLLIITTLKSAEGLVILWIQNVDYFMNLNAALDMTNTSWTTELNLTLVALIAFYVQLFFCKRLWVISKNVYIVALIVTLFVFALVASIVSSVFTFAGQLKNVTWSEEAVETLGRVLTRSFLVEIHLGTVFAGDVLLCGSTIYFLLLASRNASSAESAGMLYSITKLTFQSAAPAVVCALVSLVGTVGWNRITPDAYVMLAIIANNVLPKLYAISAMWTLNSRRSIRQAHSGTGQSSTGRTTSTATSGRRPTNDIVLSSPWVSSDGSAVIHVQTGSRHTDGIEPSSPWVSSDRSGVIQVQTEAETTHYTEAVFSSKNDRPYN
ncbi:hypothetical protein DFH09DRAFT_1000104 [Mycena vulgaris]|nr:hypothetical protein DFH09DRAFT_1000104 [Mycena vulgaris]